MQPGDATCGATSIAQAGLFEKAFLIFVSRQFKTRHAQKLHLDPRNCVPGK